jgi:chaperonin GroES
LDRYTTASWCSASKKKNRSVGGIIIPDTAKEKAAAGQGDRCGAGKTDKDDGKRVAARREGRRPILFGKYSGQEIKLDGEEYLIMREDEVSNPQ